MVYPVLLAQGMAHSASTRQHRGGELIYYQVDNSPSKLQTDSIQHRSGPKVKKRPVSESNVEVPPPPDGQEQGLNLLADLSRSAPLENGQQESHTITNNGTSSHVNAPQEQAQQPPLSAPPQLNRMQSFGTASEYNNSSLNVSPQQTLSALPPLQMSNGHSTSQQSESTVSYTRCQRVEMADNLRRYTSPCFARQVHRSVSQWLMKLLADGHLQNDSVSNANAIFQSLSLPLQSTSQGLPQAAGHSQTSQHPVSQTRLPPPSTYGHGRPPPNTQLPPQINGMQEYGAYNAHATDVYSTLAQPFTFSTAPQHPPPHHHHHQQQQQSNRIATNGGQPFQGNTLPPISNGVARSRSQQHRYDLPPAGPADSPSGGSDSAFAQSFYKADGPGLNHFHNVLSREFNVQDDASPAPAAVNTSSSHPHDPSSIVSDVGFSPAGSDVPLPPHMERDLIALADLTSTQQTLFGLYWCFVHVQWPISKSSPLLIHYLPVAESSVPTLPLISTVYRPAFGFDQAKESPALFNAMLSVTCRHDVSRQLQHVPGTLKNLPLTSRLGEIYTKRAIMFLNMNEMESSLHKVQALFMLALRDVAQGTTSRGWMFSGMATRMAFDLQLHQSIKSSKSTRTNPISQQEQRRTIWCCYVLDKSMSLFLGRPAMMKYNDIEAPLPSHWEADEYSYWAEDAKAVIPDRLNQFIGVQARPVSTVLAYIKLCQIIERIMDTVYKPKAGSARASCTAAVELNSALDGWQDEHAEIFKRAENLANSTTNLYHLLLVSEHFEAKRVE